MKIIIIEVDCCENCLNYSQYDKYPELIDYCMVSNGKKIKDIKSIPEWCPLDDKKDTP